MSRSHPDHTSQDTPGYYESIPSGPYIPGLQCTDRGLLLPIFRPASSVTTGCTQERLHHQSSIDLKNVPTTETGLVRNVLQNYLRFAGETKPLGSYSETV